MPYIRKTRDEYDIESNHGYGFDVVTCEETRQAAREQLRCYRENEPNASHRIVKRRVPITTEGV
jgi:hypothetical protein